MLLLSASYFLQQLCLLFFFNWLFIYW